MISETPRSAEAPDIPRISAKEVLLEAFPLLLFLVGSMVAVFVAVRLDILKNTNVLYIAAMSFVFGLGVALALVRGFSNAQSRRIAENYERIKRESDVLVEKLRSARPIS
jgi:hypothetical protein